MVNCHNHFCKFEMPECQARDYKLWFEMMTGITFMSIFLFFFEFIYRESISLNSIFKYCVSG